MAGLLGGGGGGPLQSVTGGDSGGPLGAVNGLTGGGGLNGLTGGVGGLTSGLGGLTGGDLGALGGLLGSGEGLNLIGLVGVGSDDPALLDLNPAVKKSKKAEILAKAKGRERARNVARQKLLQQIQQQGGQPTPEQTQLLKKLDDQRMQDDLEMAKVSKLVPDDVGPTQGFPAGTTSSTSQGGGQYVPGPGVAGSSLSGSAAPAQYAPGISICQHTMANYAPTTSILYAYLVDIERRDQSKPPSYLMTFANASVADAWYRGVSSQYQVQKVTHQFYTFRGRAPYPVTYDTSFANSSVGTCMVISGIKQDGCQMLVPPQTPEGYLVANSWQRVVVINQPCHICGSSSGTGVSGYEPSVGVPGNPDTNILTCPPKTDDIGLPNTVIPNTGLPNTSNTGLPNTSNTGLPNTSNTGLPNTSNTGLPNTSNTGLPNTSNIGLPNTSNTGLPNTSNTGLPNTSNIGLPNTSNTGLPNTSNIGLPNTSNTGLPNTSNTGLLNTNNTGLPNTGLPNTGLPNTGLPNTGLPNTGLPNTGLPNTGLPNTGLPGKTGNLGNTGSTSTVTSGGQGGQSSGGLTLHQAAGIAAQQAKQNGDRRPLQDITNDFYNQLKGSCCESDKIGGGLSGGLAGAPGVPSTGGTMPVSGVPNGVQNGGGGGGGLGGALGGVTGGLGGLTGGLGGVTGGLLPGSQGLNVAGVLALGSDESALVDLNPAEKRQKKMERLQQLQQVKTQNGQKMNQIKQEVDRNGGRATPEQQAQYAEAQKNIQAANQAESLMKASMGRDDAAGGLPGGLGGLGGGLPVGAGLL